MKLFGYFDSLFLDILSIFTGAEGACHFGRNVPVRADFGPFMYAAFASYIYGV
jgi:hypothetical protein